MNEQQLREKIFTRTKCDNCGKINPKTFPNGRLTICCSTYDKNHKNAFYTTKDQEGKVVYSIGKSSFQKMRIPFQWIGFWVW